MPKPHMGGTDMEDANKWEESTDVSDFVSTRFTHFYYEPYYFEKEESNNDKDRYSIICQQKQ